MQEVFKIRPNIWHIQDVEGVFFTVLAGEREALVVDSGYGKADHRAFVESLIHMPYLVANSHGHPDHVGGNSQYDTVYVHPADLVMAEKKGSLAADRPVLKPLQEETVYDLGGLHVRVTALPGHTKGTVGFLAEEYRLLIAGDAFNPDMWMFAENHDTLDTLEQTLEKALTLPFDSYLGSHTTKEVPQNFLREALANVRERRVDWYSWEKILGRDTYEIIHQGKYGRSSIRIDEEEALRIQATQERGFYTRLLHGNDDTHFADGATIPPVYQTSAFSHETAQEIADILPKTGGLQLQQDRQSDDPGIRGEDHGSRGRCNVGGVCFGHGGDHSLAYECLVRRGCVHFDDRALRRDNRAVQGACAFRNHSEIRAGERF